MLSRPIAFVLIVAASVGAAGGGAYLAIRQNSEARPVAELPTGVDGALELLDTPVQATEAIVEDVPAVEEAVEPEPPPVARAAPPERALTPRAARPAPQPAPPAPRSAPAPRPEPVAPAPAPSRPPAPPADTGEWVGLEEPWPPRREARRPVDLPVEQAIPSAAPVEPPPPQPTFEELIVSADSVIGLQVETPVSTEHARVEDPVDARVTRDVLVGDRIAIPAGTRMRGSVVLVERGGKVKAQARLGVRFHTLVLADGTEVDASTETIYRDGEGQGGKSAAKIGGAAVGGAILGAIFGGSKGAAIGGSVGAAGGTAAVMAGDRNEAELLAGTALTVRLSAPVAVTIEHEPSRANESN